MIAQDPKNPVNWAALVADGVCTILPVATGGGPLIRAITHVDDIGYALDLSNPYRTTNVDAQKIWDVTVEIYTEMGMTQYLDPLKESLIAAGKNLDWGIW